MNRKGNLKKQLLARIKWKNDAQALLLLYKIEFTEMFQYIYDAIDSIDETLLIIAQTFNSLLKVKGQMKNLNDIHLFLKKNSIQKTMGYLANFHSSMPSPKFFKKKEAAFSIIGTPSAEFVNIRIELESEEEKELQNILDKYCPESIFVTLKTFDHELTEVLSQMETKHRDLLEYMITGRRNSSEVEQQFLDDKTFLQLRKQLLRSVIAIHPYSTWAFFLLIKLNEKKFEKKLK